MASQSCFNRKVYAQPIYNLFLKLYAGFIVSHCKSFGTIGMYNLLLYRTLQTLSPTFEKGLEGLMLRNQTPQISGAIQEYLLK